MSARAVLRARFLQKGIPSRPADGGRCHRLRPLGQVREGGKERQSGRPHGPRCPGTSPRAVTNVTCRPICNLPTLKALSSPKRVILLFKSPQILLLASQINQKTRLDTDSEPSAKVQNDGAKQQTISEP